MTVCRYDGIWANRSNNIISWVEHLDVITLKEVVQRREVIMLTVGVDCALPTLPTYHREQGNHGKHIRVVNVRPCSHHTTNDNMYDDQSYERCWLWCDVLLFWYCNILETVEHFTSLHHVCVSVCVCVDLRFQLEMYGNVLVMFYVLLHSFVCSFVCFLCFVLFCSVLFCLFVCLFVCMFFYLFIYLFIYLLIIIY